MRKILIFVSLMICGLMLTGCKDNPFGSERKVKNAAGDIELRCVNKYVFAVYDGYNGGGLTQVWEIGKDGLPKPQLCPPSSDMKKFIWE